MPYRTKPMPELSADHIARFHSSYVKDASGCWLWNGRVQDSGYGAMYVRRSIYRAHRLSFAIHAGRDPGELIVCHRCDNPRCVNPDHLWLGTDQDNAADRETKGRGVRPKVPAHCIKCGHARDDDYIERRPGGREVGRCRNCVKLRDAASTMFRNRCNECAHYSRPGYYTARCRLGPPDWMQAPNSDPAYSTVGMHNSCGRWTAVELAA